MSFDIIQHRVKLTRAYMVSDRGQAAWIANEKRGYPRFKNVCAAVQTACRLRVWEHIEQVANELDHHIK